MIKISHLLIYSNKSISSFYKNNEFLSLLAYWKIKNIIRHSPAMFGVAAWTPQTIKMQKTHKKLFLAKGSAMIFEKNVCN